MVAGGKRSLPALHPRANRSPSLAQQTPTPSLIRLYVDIEMTDRHNTFYEKFTTRYQIGEIMAYLWQLPQV